MKKVIKQLICDALEKARDKGELALTAFPDVIVEKPKDEKLGDFSTTVAMALAKAERKNPREIAEMLCRYLKNGGSQIESAGVAGPGFINLKMNRGFFLERLLTVAEQREDFGSSDAGNREKVLLEFVSANPTGPLHVGHGRGAAVGDALARLLKKAGFDVSTEYYVNDVGNQMNMLARSTWLRYQELSGRAIDFPEDHYRGGYINDIAAEMMERHGKDLLDKPEEDVLPVFRKHAADSILKGIRKDLADFRVEFDRWFCEQSLYDDHSVDRAISWLRDKNYIYDKDGAVWLKSSAFKDDKDRVIVKRSGEKTYFCSDIAYHQNKIGRGFKMLIDIWGADHHGYVARMRAVLEAMGYDRSVFKVLLVQFVALIREGEKVSMSTRAGEFITLEDVISEVGIDATRFFFLMRSSDSHLDFDLELAKKETPENPVFYIQYAHARICSVFRTARERDVVLPGFKEIDLTPLKEDEEFSLINKILAFTEVVEKSALALEVHRISFYLQDLVSAFHGYYTRHRVVTDDMPRTLARLFLLDCLRITIRNGLDLMAVSAPEKM
ncbi:MAG: arginine--tRNA ligase [Nitrospinaceae bacterium]